MMGPEIEWDGEDWAEWHADGDDSAFYDYEPSPYDGTYSEE
jgi:hypothetical protein